MAAFWEQEHFKHSSLPVKVDKSQLTSDLQASSDINISTTVILQELHIVAQQLPQAAQYFVHRVQLPYWLVFNSVIFFSLHLFSFFYLLSFFFNAVFTFLSYIFCNFASILSSQVCFMFCCYNSNFSEYVFFF